MSSFRELLPCSQNYTKD